MSYRICEEKCGEITLTIMLVSFDMVYEVDMACKWCVMAKNTLECLNEIAGMVLVITFAKMAPPYKARLDETD